MFVKTRVKTSTGASRTIWPSSRGYFTPPKFQMTEMSHHLRLTEQDYRNWSHTELHIMYYVEYPIQSGQYTPGLYMLGPH